jgi:glycosyltransferase involved in cell wall biosynthesis
LKTLYICYFGLDEPLVQTQVLPYLAELARGGLEVHLLTFEPEFKKRWTNDRLRDERERLATVGIHWTALAYHKRPTILATLFDVIAGTLRARKLIKRHDIGIIHARSHVPGLMAVLLRRMTRRRIVFDLRGLMAEEYQDAGIWSPDSIPFRMTKRIERAVLNRADRVITLTARAARWLAAQGVERERIYVVPCCVDTSRFNEAGEVEPEYLRLRDCFTVVYAGSVTGLYLLREMCGFVRALSQRVADTHFLVLTAGDHNLVRSVALEEGLSEDSFTVMRVAPENVGQYVALARAGLSFRKPTFSQIAASPTKVPEYFAAGIPAVANAGIGDTDEIIRSNQAGVILEKLDEDSYRKAADELLELLEEGQSLRDRCLKTARQYFSLEEVGGPRYRDVYRALGLKLLPEKTGVVTTSARYNS